MAASQSSVDVKRQHDSSHVMKLNVGGREFTTRRSTLVGGSEFFRRTFSAEWEGANDYIDGVIFFDIDPDIFTHILKFLRSSVPPIFWTRKDGFDYSLYNGLYHQAAYLEINSLAQWIRDQKYLGTVLTTTSISVRTMYECTDGAGPTAHGNEELYIETADYTRGKDTTKRKRIHTRTETFTDPVWCSAFSLQMVPR